MINDVVICNNSKHNNCSNHKPLTGLQYDNKQTSIPKLLLVIIYFSSITIITQCATMTPSPFSGLLLPLQKNLYSLPIILAPFHLHLTLGKRQIAVEDK